MRYKGRYVALIEIDFDLKGAKMPFDEARKYVTEELTSDIKQIMIEEVCNLDYGTVKVTQQLADIYEVDDEIE